MNTLKFNGYLPNAKARIVFVKTCKFCNKTFAPERPSSPHCGQLICCMLYTYGYVRREKSLLDHGKRREIINNKYLKSINLEIEK